MGLVIETLLSLYSADLMSASELCNSDRVNERWQIIPQLEGTTDVGENQTPTNAIVTWK